MVATLLMAVWFALKALRVANSLMMQTILVVNGNSQLHSTTGLNLLRQIVVIQAAIAMLLGSVFSITLHAEDQSTLESKFVQNYRKLLCDEQFLQCLKVAAEKCDDAMHSIAAYCPVPEMVEVIVDNMDKPVESATRVADISKRMTECINTLIEDQWGATSDEFAACRVEVFGR